MPRVGLVLLALALAGCLSAPPPAVAPAEAPKVEPPPQIGVLAGAIEPSELAAPVFELLGAIAQGGPAYGAGEPSIWAHTDGTLYISFPGCEQPGWIANAILGGRLPVDDCVHGVTFKSTDRGATWQRLNKDGDGRLADDEKSFANGDADITVDAAGVVYQSNLGRGIQVLRSQDAGASWEYMGNVTPMGDWADRQWMAAGKAGHLITTWMGGKTGQNPTRTVAINVTWDGGATWGNTTYLGEDIGWLGTVAMDVTGQRAYIPFTQPTGTPSGPPLVGGPGEFALMVGRSLDGGATWDTVDTGVRVVSTTTGGHWSGLLMAPALDVTGDGHVVFAYSEEVPDAAQALSQGGRLSYVASADWGGNWSKPVLVSERASAIMPWVTGGAGDRAAITYFASDTPLDTDTAGVWDVMATVIDGIGSDAPKLVTSLVDARVHVGGICSRGGGCFTSGSDRALLDYFEADLMPDGSLAIVYPADSGAGKYIEIRVALQNGGTPLLARS